MLRVLQRYVHIVLGGDIVLAAYTRADLAYRHARCVTGADVVGCELRDELVESIAADVEVEWESDDDTPPVVDVDDLAPKG